jgi:acyl-CoA ligase (AMP-forming) (exosortase A-associated)
MTMSLPELLVSMARARPRATALVHKEETLDYEALWHRVQECALGLRGAHVERHDRVAIYLEKRMATVVAMFGTAAAGGAFVPLNPLLRSQQVGYVLRDCNVRVLVTSSGRLQDLEAELAVCPDLRFVVLVDGHDEATKVDGLTIISWSELLARGQTAPPMRNPIIDTDMAAILYTSGSTGMPKGVVLSHRNLVAGAQSVSTYLENTANDRILSVLPLSFDAGLSQLTTAFCVGACVVLLNYLLPRDVIRACAKDKITGITAVPPLWIQLAQQDWPREAAESIRYFANTGGHMPRTTLVRLRGQMPHAKPYLMYGLTEAFRSTYLDPAEIDRRPDSIGKAIPNAEILVVRGDGSLCQPGEQGELVHRGALVAMGYWNNPDRTAERFRPAPGRPAGICLPEIAVWSGDMVRTDEDGFLYFIGRNDDMIKTSGYRVSPTEVEEILYSTGLVVEAAAVGVPHETIGQAIVVAVVPVDGRDFDHEVLVGQCRERLPLYMVPAHIETLSTLPRTPNGKIDRKALANDFSNFFSGNEA